MNVALLVWTLRVDAIFPRTEVPVGNAPPASGTNGRVGSYSGRSGTGVVSTTGRHWIDGARSFQRQPQPGTGSRVTFIDLINWSEH